MIGKAEFLSDLLEALQLEAELSENTVLADLPEWDSLAGMILVTYFSEKTGNLRSYDEIMACRTCGELMELGGIK